MVEVVKRDDLRGLTIEELKRKLADGKEELFNLRFKLTAGQLESSAKIRQARRQIARILTIMKEREG